MKAKIIIVEDHEPIRNELNVLLSKYGYKIVALDHFETVVEDCLNEDADFIGKNFCNAKTNSKRNGG